MRVIKYAVVNYQKSGKITMGDNTHDTYRAAQKAGQLHMSKVDHVHAFDIVEIVINDWPPPERELELRAKE